MAKPIIFHTKGFDDIAMVLKRTEDIPQKCVTKAAGKGATVMKKAVKGEVPVDTGALKKGIVRKAERSRTKGKKVYDVTFDAGMNDVFQRPIKNPGEAGGQSKKGYYPASMEYGFLTRSKGGGLSYVPGYHFMQNAAQESAAPAKQAMVKTLIEEIDKEWARR